MHIPPFWTSRRALAVRPLALLSLIALSSVLAACGKSSPSSSPTAAAATRADDAVKFSRCMREHGIKNFPNPEGSGGALRLRLRQRAGEGVSPQTMQAAQRACRRYSPFAAELAKLTPQERIERQEAVLKFAKCMREHGIDLHASTSGDAVRIAVHAPAGTAGGPIPESPAFLAAQKACSGLLPKPPGGLPPGGPGGGPKGFFGGPGG